MATYLESIFRSSEGCLIEGWGWFVDIEKGMYPIPQKTIVTRPMSRPLRVPSTIVEFQSHNKLSSRKSMDSLLQFELEEDTEKDEDDRKFYNKCIGYFSVACVLVVVLFF
jgi:hypothetical protein